MHREPYIAPTEPHQPISHQEWRERYGKFSHPYGGGYEASVKPLAGEARRIVAKAVRNGELRPATGFDCTDCGKPATEYDHRDYRKPLDVEPVCRSCNLKRGPALPYRTQ